MGLLILGANVCIFFCFFNEQRRKSVRVALVHDWLTGMRGGEKCLEVLCELYPNADLYTLLHNRGTVSAIIEQDRKSVV